MKNIVFLLAMGLLLFSCGPQENPDPVIPSVTTGDVTDITTTTAFCGGNVTADGGAAVIARGVCWSTLENPTTSDSKTTDDLAQRTKAEDGTGLGTYTSHVTGLSPNTTYYVRAYATNANGTAYGEQRTFTTNAQQGMPSVTTADVIDITTTTATCGGNVTSDGGSSVTARGVCWSTSQNPTTSNSKTTNGTGVGTFTSNISGLSPNTTYYVRAYAINSEGTSYGDQIEFTTSYTQLASAPADFELTSEIRISLSWDDPEDMGVGTLLGFKIERKTQDGSEWNTIYQNTELVEYSYVDTVEAGSYNYRITAITTEGVSPYYATQSIDVSGGSGGTGGKYKIYVGSSEAAIG